MRYRVIFLILLFSFQLRAFPHHDFEELLNEELIKAIKSQLPKEGASDNGQNSRHLNELYDLLLSNPDASNVIMQILKEKLSTSGGFEPERLGKRIFDSKWSSIDLEKYFATYHLAQQYNDRVRQNAIAMGQASTSA